eukprot:gene22258-28370_t
MSTIIGNGLQGTGVIDPLLGFDGNLGPASSATVINPYGLAVDSTGSVYIAENNGHKIRKVTAADGIISVIAGTGTGQYTGDSGPSSSASVFGPSQIYLDSAATRLYIADSKNYVIRVINMQSSSMTITRFAGTGVSGSSSATGVATSTALNSLGVYGDSDGTVYFSDQGGDRILQVLSGSTIRSSVAGGQTSSDSTLAPTSDPGELLFTYTSPQVQSFTVPLSVYSMTVIVYGASAQNSVKGAWNSYGGKGAKVVSSFVVSPFDVFYVICGSQTGFNGGGSGYAYESKPGGGATDIRTNASDITTRIVVAGGGGGSAGWCGADGGDGGFNGTAGMPEVNTGYCTGGSFPATGGTQSSGGRPGDQGGTAGTLGQGGSGLNDGTGGGGGYYGGGGAYYAGGGGGSSHSADPNAVYTTGANIGNGPRPTWLPTTTAAPTRSYAASLPSQRGFSVIRSMNDTQFKIVLPFLHTNAPLATNEDFADIHVGVNVTHDGHNVYLDELDADQGFVVFAASLFAGAVYVLFGQSRDNVSIKSLSDGWTLRGAPCTVKPTVRTVKPSRAPSERPSQLPTRCPVSPSTRPTTPTMGPTPSPTGPSMCPSVIPSSPSSVPSSPPSLLTTSPSVAVTQFYTAEPTEQPITDFPSLSPTYKQTLSPSVAPSAVPSKAPSRPPTFLPSVMTRVTRQPSTARPTTTASPSALTTLNITLTSGGSYAQVFGRVHYFINATDTVRIVKPAMRNSASSYIYSISPNPKTLFVIEQFDNHTDVIDLVAFDTIPKFSSLNITRGSVVITLPHRQVIRILNLQPQDVSRSNFLFYIPTNATQVDPVMIANEHESIKSQLIILSSVSGAVLLFLIWMCFSSRSPCGSYLKRNRRQRKTLYESPVVVLTNMDSDTSFVSFGSSTSSGSESSKQSSGATSHSSVAERLGHFLYLAQSSSGSRGGGGGGGESKSSVELCHCANIFCDRHHFHAVSSGSQDTSRTNSLDEGNVSTSDDSSSSDDTSSLAKHGSQQLERGVNVGNSMNRIRLSSEALSDYSSLSDDDEATTVSASRKMKQHDNLSIEHNATEPNGSHRLSTRLPSKTRSQSCEQQHSDPEGGEDDSCSSDYNSVILSSDDENE